MHRSEHFIPLDCEGLPVCEQICYSLYNIIYAQLVFCKGSVVSYWAIYSTRVRWFPQVTDAAVEHRGHGESKSPNRVIVSSGG